MTAVVIGGGLAGAATAVRLAEAGRAVTLFERSTGPVDKMCGEFLSHEACGYLAALDIDVEKLGALPIDSVRLCSRHHRAVSVPLPFAAMSLSRRVLDEALLERARSAGATVVRGAKVRELSPTADAWRARLEDGRRLDAKVAFLATGKHDLRGHARPPGLQNDLVALKMHWELAPGQAAELAGHVELMLFSGGYAGLQLVEGGRANLCLLVRQRRLASLGRHWDGVLAAIRAESSHLDLRLTGAKPCSSRPFALSAIPYGYLRKKPDRKGLFRLGDQAAVVPSFSGDGMSIALHSAELAATTYLQGGHVADYQTRLAKDVSFPVLLGTLISHGLVRDLGQLALGALARLWPGLVSIVASATRVPDVALASVARAGRS
jgi:menaquinone-9 beta-reductase